MDTIAIAALPQEERTMAQPIPPLPPKLDDNMVPNCKVKGQPKPIGKKTFNALIVERRTQYYETDDKDEIFDLFKDELVFVALNSVTNTWEPQTERGSERKSPRLFMNRKKRTREIATKVMSPKEKNIGNS